MRRKGEASRFKSTLIDPNAQEMNVYNDWNVARKDEAGRPHLVRCGPGLLDSSSSVFLFSGIWLLLVQKRKEKMGERRRDTRPRIRPV